MRIFSHLMAYFDLDDLSGQNAIEIELEKFLSPLTENDLKKEEYTFIGKCCFCQMSDYNYYHPISLPDKLNQPYSKSAMILGVRHQPGT